MKRLYAILAFILIGCAMPDPTNYGEQEKYSWFYDRFNIERRIRNLTDKIPNSYIIPIRTTTMSGNTVATCNLSTKEITVNSKMFDPLTLPEQEQVIFHEFGHCLLRYRLHVINKVAIMNQFMLSGAYYTKNRTALIDDLFNDRPNP